MEVVIVGAPNVGKSLFVINFTQYLGSREIQMEESSGASGLPRDRRLSFEKARRDLVSLYSPKTTQIQTMTAHVLINRQPQRLYLLDTPGINDGIAPDAAARWQIARTLERALTATTILHMIDASLVATRRRESLGAFDMAMLGWGRQLDCYGVIAHKMDRPGSHEGLRILRTQFPDVPIIPVSSITRRGYRELKLFLVRALT
ncbi:MAG: GTP-binding protein HSR1 [Sulfobacillus acidophilus]|uniref:GTP-binding protein HSR1 n=1 Tax=Sulfobacillus acidophilus TaxID=53633 RepID=A0A2T2WES3_9FIRM|nr:MAG: GTP-binding protein HSR1 [Sulfobacillus acidophilus]